MTTENNNKILEARDEVIELFLMRKDLILKRLSFIHNSAKILESLAVYRDKESSFWLESEGKVLGMLQEEVKKLAEEVSSL